jgi:hypothetical protein
MQHAAAAAAACAARSRNRRRRLWQRLAGQRQAALSGLSGRLYALPLLCKGPQLGMSIHKRLAVIPHLQAGRGQQNWV